MSAVLTRDDATRAALGAATLVEAFRITAAARADGPAIRTRDGSVEITWRQYAEAVGRAMAALRSFGIGRGDRVALLLTNRPEFHIVDCAVLQLGAVPVSVYPTAAPDQVQHVIDDSGARLLIAESALAAVAAAVTVPAPPVLVDGAGSPLALARLLDEGTPGELGEPVRTGPDDLATLIYTSGTTGAPKGVRISHRNVMAALRSFAETIAFPQQARIVSYLPMAHVAERNTSQYLPMALGFDVTCIASPRDVLEALAEVRPVWFFGVPRIWEKLKTRIELAIPAGDAITARALGRSLTVVRAAAGAPPPAATIQAGLAPEEQAALAALRAQHGLDELRAANVGAAPTPTEVLEFFHAIGVPLSELWGMSETTGLGTVSPVDAVRFHTVGRAAPGVELAIAEDGEVLIRGDVVTGGYENRPEATAEALDSSGWLHTGDTGRLADGYLEIVGRKKELIINAAGENMSPVLIEAELKSADGAIAHACVIGDGRRYNVALLALDADVAAAEDAALVNADGSFDVPALSARIDAAVHAANARLARVQQVKRHLLLPRPWGVGEELTPTMKIRRAVIEQRYATEIERLYADGGAP